MLLELLLLDST